MFRVDKCFHSYIFVSTLSFFNVRFSLAKYDYFTKTIVILAIVLGILFQLLGVIALFNERFLVLVIGVLMLQNLWTVAASIALLVKKENSRLGNDL